MRHRRRRGKLGRKSEHRNMMLRNLATSLFDKERITTTMPKAKQLRPYAEKLITLARRQDLHSRRLAAKYILNRDVAKKLFDEIATRFASDNGGYTRIVPYRSRWGDGAELAIIELKVVKIAGEEESTDKKKKKGAAKKSTAPAKGSEKKESASTQKKAAKGKEAGEKKEAAADQSAKKKTNAKKAKKETGDE